MKKSVFILVAVVLLATGCKKKNDSPAVIRTVTYAVNNEVYTYGYNSDGRINAVMGSEGDQITYSYFSNTITATHQNSNSTTTGTTTYFLNNDLRADSIADVSSIPYFYKNTFNSDGYLTEQKQYDANNHLVNTFTYTITNENITSVQQSNGLTTNTFSTKANNVGNVNMGMPFLGKDSKNLIASCNSPVSNIAYTYTYDNEGRVSSQTASYTSLSSSSVSQSYNYY